MRLLRGCSSLNQKNLFTLKRPSCPIEFLNRDINIFNSAAGYSILRLMDTYRLQVFLECARLKNFSRAAEVLHLSQPSISLHVRGLEDWCGARLFDRRGRRVELTEAGERLKEHAQRIVASLATARHDVREILELRSR